MDTRLVAAGTGALIALLGGLIGLGGAEFRLSVLVGLLRLAPRAAVPANLVVSLVTLATALASRLWSLDPGPLAPLAPEIAALAAGGLVSAFTAPVLLARLSDQRLARLLGLLLVAIGVLLVVEAFLPGEPVRLVPAGLPARFATGLLLGLLIGAVAALLGVAGGELLVPTFLFCFGAAVHTAGTASVLVSLLLVPTALLRYARLGALPRGPVVTGIVLPMAAGSVVGAALGGLAAGLVPAAALKLLLGLALIASAAKVLLAGRVAAPRREAAATASIAGRERARRG